MTSRFRNLFTELREDAVSVKALPALAAGITSGLALLVAQIAFGTLIFSGPLAPYSSQGIGLVLFGNMAACLVIALAGSFRGAISGLPAALVIVLAQIGASTGGEGYARFVTTAGTLIFGAVTVGVCFLMIGRFRLAKLLRFVPYSVAAGFVGGIGGAVCLAALSLVGAELDLRAIPALMNPAALWIWSPAVAFGVCLYLAVKQWGHPLILPIGVTLAVGVYHLALFFLDISGAEARATGLLLSSTAESGLWPALGFSDLAHLDWSVMAAQFPQVLMLVLVSIIVVIMNTAGLEMAAKEDLDWNRELRATGMANVIAGLGGATVASVIVSASVRSKLFGAVTRLTGIVASLVILTGLFLGDGMLELVPVALVGGILFFAGLALLDQGLVQSRKRLPWMEYGVIVLIAGVTVVFGLFEGVSIGMLAALVFFTVRLSRLDPIRSRFTARDRHSTKARSMPDCCIIAEEGERVQVWRLRGYVFFGSVYPLADQLKGSLSRDPPPVCVIVDFTDVSGFDISAVNVLARFLQSASGTGVQVVLSAPSEQVRTGLQRNLSPSEFADVRVEPSMDRALEFCEDLVIEDWRISASSRDEKRTLILDRVAAGLDSLLEHHTRFEDLIGELKSWLKPGRYHAGEAIAGPGVPSEGLQLLTSGRASAHDSAGKRSRQYGMGDAIWPIDPSDDDAPSVSAEGHCETVILTPAARHHLEEHAETLALKLYRYLLAGRLKGEAPPARRD